MDKFPWSFFFFPNFFPDTSSLHAIFPLAICETSNTKFRPPSSSASLSDTSSKRPEEDLQWAYGDATYGIQEKCWCGRVLKVETCTAEGSHGRKYLTCPDRLEEGSGVHLFQWWDVGVTEQLGILERQVKYQKEQMWKLETDIKGEVRGLRGEVESLKEEVRVLRGQLTRLNQTSFQK
ncbi:uncharacterized protein At4g04775-like [Eutrema salsugineum]|uniref:uncharacterized protein At4g04775-like n=1 Tax=Eutrema salsugineum TaxID=72664 RepID=UPI000CED14AF|nr:uncharacterized protein At4g04775-like [Eutrema salsugineum]